MQEEYPKVVSEWESATIEMESLSLQLKKRLEQQEQLIDMLEKLRISIASKDNSLDDQIQKSLHKEKYSKLEKELESLKHAVLNAKAREKNAQIYLFNEAFSDHSIKCIERTCRQNMERLQHDLVIAQSMMDAKRKQLEVSSSYSGSLSLREEVSRLADNIEYKKFDMKTKSKILELCTILHSGISVCDQWCNAQQNYEELTIKIEKVHRGSVSAKANGRNTKKTKDDLLLERRDGELKTLHAELFLERRDRELKTLQAFQSILTKIDMVGSCVNESNPQEDKESTPQEDKESKPEKQSINIICKQDNQPREDYTDQRELELEEENVEYSQNERPNFNLVTYESLNYSENTSNQHEDKESILEKQSANIICKKENIRDDYTASKELKLEEENLEDNQNKQKNSELSNERFQNEYGIIIKSLSRQNLSYKADPWNSDERLDVLESKVFPEMFQLCTDIFHISESTAVNPRKGARVPAKDVRLKVLLPTEYSPYHEYKGAIKVGNSWMIIDYSIQDDYMVFDVDQVDSFCVLSLVRQEKHTISPDGSQFISEIDNRIQTIFPPNAVMKEEVITFMIHPVNISCILERTTESTNAGFSINAITPMISTIHMKFTKMFKVQLPLHSISNSSGNTQDYLYCICKWNDDGSFKFIDLQPSVSNGLVCFEANSFSGYGCVGTSQLNSPSSLESMVQEAYGLKKWCKILFFVGKLKKYNLPIMLECVELQRVEDVCKKRENYGYQFVSEWNSKDLFLTPDKTIISVDVKGMFSIPIESGVKQPKLSFVPSARDNFTLFLVNLQKRGKITYGMLALRENRRILYEIYYDPDTCTVTHTNPVKKIGNRGKQPVETVRPPNKQTPSVRDFFTEKGLLALSKSMSPDTMMEVCINMNMTLSRYDTLQEKYGIGTVRGYLKLWKTALDQQPHNKKLENLIKALIASGQKSLADKVQLLQSTGKDLDDF